MTILPIYELTVFDDDDTSELFDISTDPVHARPYLKAPTNFPEQEVHFAKGSASIGQMNVQVVDVPTDATDQDTGYLTGQLEDASGFSALLGHRALVTEDLGGGATTILDGVIKSIRLLDTFASYELELRDIRERERTATAFTNTTTPTVFPRGALDGFGELRSVSIPFFNLELTFRYPLPPTVPLRATYNSFSATRGEIVVKGIQPRYQQRRQWTDAMLEVMDHVAPLEAQPEARIFDRVKVLWRDTAGGGAYTELTQIAHQHPDLPEGGGQTLYRADAVFIRALQVNNEVSGDTLPADAQAVDVIVQYDGPPTEDWPHYIIDLTVGELLRNLYRGDYSDEDPRIRYDETALLLLTTPVSGIIKEPIKDLRKWAEKNAYPIAHAAPVLNATGEISPISYVLPDEDETLIDLDNNNCRPAGGGWSHGTEDAINIVKVTYRRDYRIDRPTVESPNTGAQIPDTRVALLDLLREREVVIERRTQDSIDLLGERELEVDSVLLRATGSIGGGPSDGDVRSELGEQVARRVQHMASDRFALGGQYFALEGDRSDSDVEAIIPGTWLTVSVSWMPDYGTGERNLNRLAQVISRRNVSANWAGLTLLDAGTAQAPLAPPTLGVVAVDTEGVVSIPVTALGSGAECRVDYAMSTLEPAAGDQEWTFVDRVTSVPTTITTPPVPQGAVVWVRARSENIGRRPSAYIAAVSVTAVGTARVVEVLVELDDDGIPKVFWTPNAAANGVEIHYERHLLDATPTFPDSFEFDADDESATLSTLDPVTEGYAFSVQVEPWTGFAGGAVSGTAGPRVESRANGSLVALPVEMPPLDDLEWYGPFDEGSGLTLRDHSGNVRDATPESSGAAITWVGGVSGKAIDFPGSGVGYELLTDALAGAIEGLFYVSCWIKVDATGGDATAVIIGRDDSDYWAIQLEQDEAFPQDIVFNYSDTEVVTIEDAITTAGVWYFILAQWDVSNTTVELWVGSEATGLLNRIFRSEGVAAFAATSRPIALGSDTEAAPDATNPFEGVVDDVRIGAPAALLTQTQVNSLFRNPGYGSGLIEAVRPEVFVKEVRASTTSVVTIDIEDTHLRVTAVEYKKRDGIEGGDTLDAGWLTAWTSTVGTIGTDETLQRVIDVPVDDGLEGELQWRVQWTDAYGNTQTIGDSFKVVNLEGTEGSVMVPYSDVLPLSQGTTWTVDTSTSTLRPGDASAQNFAGSVELPPGVTATSAVLIGYREGVSDSVVLVFKKVTDTGTTPSDIATITHDTTGYQAKAATISELIAADTIYTFHVTLDANTLATHVRFRGFKVIYDRPAYVYTI